jgi:hypothetical protein
MQPFDILSALKRRILSNTRNINIFIFDLFFQIMVSYYPHDILYFDSLLNQRSRLSDREELYAE